MHRIMLIVAALTSTATQHVVIVSPLIEKDPVRASTSPSREIRGPLLSATSAPRRLTRPRGDSAMLNYIFDSYATSNKHFHDALRPPSFENDVTIDVSADTGHTVKLNCTVSALRDKMVSWIRVKSNQNLELLTLNLETHSADPRYRVDLEGDNWKLALMNARTNDSGIYRCHVSTHPPMIARVNLTVYSPEIFLTQEAYLESRETLSLKCMILHLHPGEATTAIRWYKENSTAPVDAIRGGVLIETDNLNLTSQLLVAKLKIEDAGTYTCALESPLKMKAAARVVVLQGSSLAELQSGVKSVTSYLSLLLTTIVIVSWTFQDIR